MRDRGVITKDDITFVGWEARCTCGYTVSFSSQTDDEPACIARWNGHAAHCVEVYRRSPMQLTVETSGSMPHVFGIEDLEPVPSRWARVKAWVRSFFGVGQ